MKEVSGGRIVKAERSKMKEVSRLAVSSERNDTLQRVIPSKERSDVARNLVFEQPVAHF